MIVLDTNVLSELMRRHCSPRVLSWARGQVATSLFTTTISEAEVFYGLAVLPAGRRRAALEAAASGLFDDFGARVLPFDSAAARELAAIAAARKSAGRPISAADAQIAAIARSRSARLATRDTSGFLGCEVALVDPFGG